MRCAFFSLQQAKEMVMELIRDQDFREQRGEYGSRVGGGGGGGDSLDVSGIIDLIYPVEYEELNQFFNFGYIFVM